MYRTKKIYFIKWHEKQNDGKNLRNVYLSLLITKKKKIRILKWRGREKNYVNYADRELEKQPDSSWLEKFKRC